METRGKRFIKGLVKANYFSARLKSKTSIPI